MPTTALNRGYASGQLALVPRAPEPRPRMVRGASARYLFFTNECVGLGHLRRSLTLAAAVRAADPAASSLIVTGSPGDLAEDVPGVDLIRLPALNRDERGSYGARTLGATADNVFALRSQVATATALAWDPDVVVVDKLPLGLDDELHGALRALRRRGMTRIVLGLRDIEDDPEAVRRRWARAGTLQVLRDLYDQVLVYGPCGSPDALACVGADLDVPVSHVGYVGAALPSRPPADLRPGYVLVTTGGGADGYQVARAVLDAVRAQPLGAPVLLVAGPLMPGDQVAELHEAARGLDVHIESSRSDLAAVVVGARAVVCMAGYNTVSEVLRAAKPTLLVPRARPSSEQLIRATALVDQGVVAMLHPDLLDAPTMSAALRNLLEQAPPLVDRSQYDGAAAAAAALTKMVRR